MLISGLYLPVFNYLALLYLIYIFFRFKIISRDPSNYWFLIILTPILLFFSFNSWEVLGNLSSISVFIFFWLLIILKGKNINLQRNILNQTAIFLILIMFFNFLIYIFLGSVSYDGYANNSTSLEYFGFDVQRPQFLISNGINHYAISLGFFILFILAWRKTDAQNCKFIYKYRTVLNLLLISHFFLLLFFIESRSAIIAIFLSYFGSKLFGKSRWFHYFLTLIPLLVPIVFIYLMIIEVEIETLNREGSSFLSYREILWINAVNGINELPIFNLFFGSGSSGYINYSFSDEILFFFENRSGENLGSLHNLYLQMLYEFGLIGIIMFIISYIWIIKKLFDSQVFKNLSAIIIYFFLVSSTEATMSISYLFIFSILITYCLFTYNKFLYSKKPYVLKSTKCNL